MPDSFKVLQHFKQKRQDFYLGVSYSICSVLARSRKNGCVMKLSFGCRRVGLGSGGKILGRIGAKSGSVDQ